MQRTFYTFLILVVALLPVACDNTGTTTTFKGIVTDTDTKQPLTGVSVMVMPMNLGGETSESGSYSIEMPRTDADVYLVFSYPGYEEHTSANMPLSPKRVNEYTLNVSLKQKVAKAVLSSQTIDFGAQQTSVSVLLSNPGTDTLRWNLPSMYFPQWLEVSPAEGVLAMNGSQEIIFLCDRTG
ncbi:MAG: carboxypeptidase-like regulatory domain-containing protein, partial [Bacteroidales bacterium]